MDLGPAQAILDVLKESITIRDQHDRIVWANRAALVQLGYETVEQLAQTQPQSIMSEYTVTDEHGEEIAMADIPSVRVLRGMPAEPLLIHTVHRETGVEAWRLLKASALHNGEGEIEAAVTIIEDVTASKRAEMRMHFLARTSEILASSLEYEQTLLNIAQLAVPEIADWCALDLIDEQGLREPVAVAHSDPQKLLLAADLRAYAPERPDPDQGMGLLLRTGKPQLYPEITDEMLAGGAIDDEHLRLLRAVGMRSVLLVALRAGGRTLGSMSLVSAESGRTFTEDDIGFAEAIAERAAVAVENSRLYTERARASATLQRSLLPAALPEIDGWQLASLYRPAGDDGVVGGDFYDVFPADDGWLVLIGDVTGKGIEAAAMTALVRHSARIVGEDNAEPAHVLERLNRRLRQEPALSISTALCARISPDGRALIASGGHPLAMAIDAAGVPHEVGRPGTVLGAFDEGTWPTDELVVEPGGSLLLYTDGVTDTLGEDGRLGAPLLHRLVEECGPAAPQHLLRCLDSRLNDFQAGAQADDTAALALRRLPSR
ncbi:MAG: hypothetical protein NVSMB51_17920 [Solirubrobacteraceae bacterium]